MHNKKLIRKASWGAVALMASLAMNSMNNNNSGGNGSNMVEELGNMTGQMTNAVSSFIPDKSATEGDHGGLTSGMDAAYDGISDAAMAIVPWGTVAGIAMKGAGLINKGIQAIGGGTDGMTGFDAFADSNFGFAALGPLAWINGFGGKKANTFTKNKEVFAQMGSSYGGSSSAADLASHYSGKKYGLFSAGARHEANRRIAEAKNLQNTIEDIQEESNNLNILSASMNDTYANAYSNKLQGGYLQGTIHAARRGMILYSYEQRLRVKDILKAAKGSKLLIDLIAEKYGKDFSRFYNTIPDKAFAENNVEKLKVLFDEADLPNSFLDIENIDNIIDIKDGVLNWTDKANLYFDSYDKNDDNTLEDYVIKLPEQSNIEDKIEDLENQIQYDQKGGQLNIIPEGALHKNKHHLEDVREDLAGDITHKGIPVVSTKEDGTIELQAEIEKEEIIFNLDVTKQIEELRKQYHEEESPSKKDEIARQAGEILSNSIIEDTDDKTGLINKIEE